VKKSLRVQESRRPRFGAAAIALGRASVAGALFRVKASSLMTLQRLFGTFSGIFFSRKRVFLVVDL